MNYIDRIKSNRVRRGWNQRDLARKSGLSQNQISRIENGAPLTGPALSKIESAFKAHPPLIPDEVAINTSSPADAPVETDFKSLVLSSLDARAWSQTDLSIHSGIGAATISRIMQNKDVSPRVRRAILSTFDRHPVDESRSTTTLSAPASASVSASAPASAAAVAGPSEAA